MISPPWGHLVRWYCGGRDGKDIISGWPTGTREMYPGRILQMDFRERKEVLLPKACGCGLLGGRNRRLGFFFRGNSLQGTGGLQGGSACGLGRGVRGNGGMGDGHEYGFWRFTGRVGRFEFRGGFQLHLIREGYRKTITTLPTSHLSGFPPGEAGLVETIFCLAAGAL